MTMACPDCIYFDNNGSLCRLRPPVVELSGQTAVTYWPTVQQTDWCAEGWNVVDGSYNHAATTKPLNR